MQPQSGDGPPAPVVGFQPQPVQQGLWMPMPARVTGCPPGLEYLTMVDQILCHQIVELLQAFTGWETNNRYALKNSMGQQIFYAFEDTDCCSRMLCGPQREFTLHIVNNYNQEVMRIYRPLKICAGAAYPCFADIDCCSQELHVEAPVGTVIGSVHQTASCFTADYAIKDPSGETQMVIKGPCCPISCFGDVEFPVYGKDGETPLGTITKQWTGLAKELFTQADNFGVKFPMDLDVNMKATLIGATFLIDFMIFERQQ